MSTNNLCVNNENLRLYTQLTSIEWFTNDCECAFQKATR